MITYRKTKQGEWVVFGPVTELALYMGGELRCRGEVLVTKKSGEVVLEQLDKLGTPFDVAGEQYVYGYIAKRAPAGRGGHGSDSRCKSGTGDCWSFGVTSCWECGS